MRGVFVYFGRDLLRWSRGKLAVISALVMPAAWLVFVGLALPIRFTDNYLDFITPGILVMTMLTASLTGGALLIFDKILGFFQKFLALPVSQNAKFVLVARDVTFVKEVKKLFKARRIADAIVRQVNIRVIADLVKE